jgi:hypothetical protein
MCKRNRQEFFLQHISFSQRTQAEQMVLFSNAIQLRAPVNDSLTLRADRIDSVGCYGYAILTRTPALAAQHAEGDCRGRCFSRLAVVYACCRPRHGFRPAVRERIGAVQHDAQSLLAADHR